MNVINRGINALLPPWGIGTMLNDGRGDFVSLGDKDPFSPRKRQFAYTSYPDGRGVVTSVWEISLTDSYTEKPRVLEPGGFVEVMGNGVIQTMPKADWDKIKNSVNGIQSE